MATGERVAVAVAKAVRVAAGTAMTAAALMEALAEEREAAGASMAAVTRIESRSQ